jgi:formylglycine-generating enzyme required for sulfatase activity
VKPVAKFLVSLVPGGDTLMDFGEYLVDVWDRWKKLKPYEPARREELQALVHASPDRVEAAVHAAVQAEASGQPEAVKKKLTAYMAEVQGAIRRSLCRPDDPEGKTVPGNLPLNSAQDLRPFVPRELPRFTPRELSPPPAGTSPVAVGKPVAPPPRPMPTAPVPKALKRSRVAAGAAALTAEHAQPSLNRKTLAFVLGGGLVLILVSVLLVIACVSGGPADQLASPDDGESVVVLAPPNKKRPLVSQPPAIKVEPQLAQPPNKEPPFVSSIGMKFVLIPPGTAWLGGGGGNLGARKVKIAREFYLGVFPVTQGQWQSVIGSNPSLFSRTGAGKQQVEAISDADLLHFPVEQVSWEDAQQFLLKLNDQDGKIGWLYRLPTADEWEYACRGGLVSRELSAFDFYVDKPSDDLSSDLANFDGDFPSGSAGKGPFLRRTPKVGQYPGNA